jgi:hypothetical protein
MAERYLVPSWRLILGQSQASRTYKEGPGWLAWKIGFPMEYAEASRDMKAILDDLEAFNCFTGEGAYIPAERPAQRLAVDDGLLLHLDAGAAVPQESLLPWLMPLHDLLLSDVIDKACGKNRVPEDIFYLQLPRATELALVSTFIGLLNTLDPQDDTEAFLKGAFERLLAAHSANTTGPPLAPLVRTFLDEVRPRFQERMKAIRDFIEAQRAGILVGCSTGSGDAFARFVSTVAAQGLATPGALDCYPDPDPSKLIHTPGGDPATGSGASAPPPPSNTPFIDSWGDFQHANHNALAGLLCELFHARGEQITIATACCSGQVALTTAARALTTSLPGVDAEVIVVTGVDSCLSGEFLAAFHQLGVLAGPVTARGQPAPASAYASLCEPWGVQPPPPIEPGTKRLGWVLGEGAGTVVISRAPPEGRPAVRIAHAAIRNTAHVSPEKPYSEKFRVLASALPRRSKEPGLMYGFSLGDARLFDPLEYLIAQVGCHTRGVRHLWLCSIKEWTGHSMAGSSILAAVSATAALTSRDPDSLPQMRSIGRKLRWTWMLAARPTELRELAQRFPRLADDAPVVYLPHSLAPEQRPRWAVLNGTGLGNTAAAMRLERED